jgi:hypothetical protein
MLIYYLFSPILTRMFEAIMNPLSFFTNLALILLDVPADSVNVAGITGLIGILFFFLVASWVLSSTEASGSIGLALAIPALLALPESLPFLSNPLKFITAFLTAFNDFIALGVILALIILIVRTELYRRSITYILTSTDLVIKGGIWRKQEHRIPYDQIGRVVMEQSIIGRKLNYGTIIPVGVAEWGAEYYTRAVGVGMGESPTVAAGYARTLKEVSRDPMKCLYGISNPSEVLSKLQKMITVPYRAEVDQVDYLKKIYEKIGAISTV